MVRKSPSVSDTQEDLDVTILNLTTDNREESHSTSQLPQEQNSEHIWAIINQRLEELERRTQRIVGKEQRHLEQ